jgi:hypothetical protein
MTHDDDRIAHLMGEPSDALDGADVDALDDLRELLADPSVWASPSDALEGRVVAAIAAEAASRAGAPVAPVPVPAAVRAHRRRPARRTQWVVATLAVAAVALAVVLAGTVLSRGSRGTQINVALAAVGAPGPSGSATLTRTNAGWEVELRATGLPRLDNGAYYEAWLKNAAGVLVPVGTFNEGGYITLWAGVSPLDYPGFTVTVEAADGNQASSGQRVLAGTVVAKG